MFFENFTILIGLSTILMNLLKKTDYDDFYVLLKQTKKKPSRQGWKQNLQQQYFMDGWF